MFDLSYQGLDTSGVSNGSHGSATTSLGQAQNNQSYMLHQLM